MFDDYDEADEYADQAAALTDGEFLVKIALTLAGHFWSFGQAPKRDLCTSDSPVVRRAHIQDPVMSFNGFGSPGVEVAFPLSPGRMLVMFERSHYGLGAAGEGKLQRLSQENVLYYNAMQVQQSTRQVYARLAEHFDLAEEICKKEPHVRDPGRSRMLINGQPPARPE